MATVGGADYGTMTAVAGVEWALPAPERTSEVERLLQEFEAHESEEEKFVRSYRELLEKTKSPAIKLLLSLIVSDEEKHRAITGAMASTLKGALLWRRIEGALGAPKVPAGERAELLELTEGFLRVERRQLKEYKKLLKPSEGYYGGLFKVLLGCMVHDSEKHIAILEFLKKSLGR